VITTSPTRTATPPRLSPLVLAAIIITVLAWASAFIVIRGTTPFFSGGALALGRLLVGSVLLSLAMIGRTWVRPTWREWLLVAAFGVAWFGAYNVALNLAERTLDAGTTAMVVNTGPILIALGAGWILREGIPTWLAIGAGAAFVGVVFIAISTGGGIGTGPGVVLALIAAVTYAAGVLFQKPALRRLPAAQVTWLGCGIGMLTCLPFTGDLAAGLATAPGSAILGVVYLGAVPTALAFSTWAYALARMPAGQLGISTYVVPPLAILLGFVVLAEVPAPLATIGGAICLTGVALSRRRA
jgi:drug/metabolite transporter (DMT)-like permease